ncbi:MAG: NUDIX hydrolase [Patescibacteria group bacterium]
MPESLQAAVAVILDQEGKSQILLTRRQQPEKPHKHNRWHLPGGAVEEGELPSETIARELEEELTLKSFTHIAHKTVEVPNSDFNDQMTLFHLFLIATSQSADLNITQDPDANDIRWFELKDMAKIQSFPLVTLAIATFKLV